jgi:hypothetical protein
MRYRIILYSLLLLILCGCQVPEKISVTSDDSYLASDMKVQIYVTIGQVEYIASGNVTTNTVSDNVTK